MAVLDWGFPLALGRLCLLFHQGCQPVQKVPLFRPIQEFLLIRLHQEYQGDLESLENLSAQQTPSHPSDLAGLATQWPLASRGSPGSQLGREIPEGLSAQAGLSCQLMRGDLSRLLDLSSQDVLKCLESLALLGARVCP